MLTKAYPKDNEPRTMGLPPDLVDQFGSYIAQRRLKTGDLLFATREGTPISRNTFRTRVWRPAVAASGGFDVRVHDLRHAHASWLLAGGSDLKSVMDRMGHAQITTTQTYLHSLPNADQKNLEALNRIRGRASDSQRPRPATCAGRWLSGHAGRQDLKGSEGTAVGSVALFARRPCRGGSWDPCWSDGGSEFVECGGQPEQRGGLDCGLVVATT